VKISEYIKKLEEIQKTDGDLDVFTYSNIGRHEPSEPKVSYALILNKRQSRPEFYESYLKDESKKGEKVCQI